jgi:hypothetical protein
MDAAQHLLRLAYTSLNCELEFSSIAGGQLQGDSRSSYSRIAAFHCARWLLLKRLQFFVLARIPVLLAAILASLTNSCRRHDVDPQLYLTQLLMSLAAARLNELSAGLLDQWRQLQAARIANRLSSGSPSA